MTETAKKTPQARKITVGGIAKTIFWLFILAAVIGNPARSAALVVSWGHAIINFVSMVIW